MFFCLSKENLLGRLKQMGECDRRCASADGNCVCVCLCFCVMWLDVFALVDHSHYTLQDSGFKVKTYPEIKMMSLFTHRQVFPNLFFLYNFLSSVEDKWRKK